MQAKLLKTDKGFGLYVMEKNMLDESTDLKMVDTLDLLFRNLPRVTLASIVAEANAARCYNYHPYCACLLEQ